MKTLITLALTLASFASAQTALTSTTLAAAANSTTTVIRVASASGITARGNNNQINTYLYVDRELMAVISVSGVNITVQRGVAGTASLAHVSGAYAIIGPAAAFPVMMSPPVIGSACTPGNQQYTPTVSVTTGYQYICSTISNSWVAGWNTPGPYGATATVASAAGAIQPSGPLFTVSGTAAVTGFTAPVGWTGVGSFCTVPTGAYTFTTAGNIGLAGTAVVGRVLCFTWHATASKWYPSYV